MSPIQLQAQLESCCRDVFLKESSVNGRRKHSRLHRTVATNKSSIGVEGASLCIRRENNASMGDITLQQSETNKEAVEETEYTTRLVELFPLIEETNSRPSGLEDGAKSNTGKTGPDSVAAGGGRGVGATGDVLLASLVEDILEADTNEDRDWREVNHNSNHNLKCQNIPWRSSLEHWSKRPRPDAPEPAPIRLERVPARRPELMSVVSPA